MRSTLAIGLLFDCVAEAGGQLGGELEMGTVSAMSGAIGRKWKILMLYESLKPSCAFLQVRLVRHVGR